MQTDIIPAAAAPLIGALLAQATEAVGRDPDEALRCLDALGRMLAPRRAPAADLLRPGRIGAEAEAAEGALAPWQMRRVEAWLEAHLAEPVRVEALAALTSLSAGHFSRRFKAATGASPRAYVIRLRVARAQRMMLDGDAALSEIAQACGFADQAHLTHAFGRHVGEAPAAWRRRHAPA